jgi:hypothetical protein
VFLGYSSGVKSYRLWNAETKKVLYNKNVVFHEVVMFHKISTIGVYDAINFSDVSDDEKQMISVHVEHVEKK